MCIRDRCVCVCVCTDEEEPGVWEVMSPLYFRPIAVPFKLEGETEDNPFPLPQPYQDELAIRRK